MEEPKMAGKFAGRIESAVRILGWKSFLVLRRISVAHQARPIRLNDRIHCLERELTIESQSLTTSLSHLKIEQNLSGVNQQTLQRRSQLT